MKEHGIEFLIAQYQEEQARLKVLINESMAADETLMAHYHAQALYLLNRKIQTLQTIEDRWHYEKLFLQSRIHDWEEKLDQDLPEYLRQYFNEVLQDNKAQLEKLLLAQRPKIPVGKENLFDQVLENLFARKIKNVRLFVKKSDNFYFRFSYSKDTLNVTLPNVKQLSKKDFLNEDYLEKFRLFGFSPADNGHMLTLTVSGNRNDLIKKVKTILSRIIFDVFYFVDFENESCFEYVETSQRQ
ncbi:hypothetical protein [Flavihumibacter petaseus]|uniref:Uncharacterized protein n=1 Tax=Flavihumibacter petaseus NBRC 106054 TaxID=1220578 RepID=A0A0E9MVD3_9BACT|nr:hypothetical protein [Flavihumibacter petaseus]GAO41371.1 hypothetical protein FPE01S_01_03830 [Flavihumibacter petaseus NBRC 106054]